MMSGNRPHQSAGGASSVPSTSSSSNSSSSSGAASTGNSNGGGGGSSAVPGNGSSSGNLVPSRTLTAATEGGLSVPSLAAVPSSRGGFASLCRPSASSGSRKKSLHQTPLYNGLLNSYEDKSNDFVWWVFSCTATVSNVWTQITWSSSHNVPCLLSPAPFVLKWSRRHTWPSVGTVFGKSGGLLVYCNFTVQKKSSQTGCVVVCTVQCTDKQSSLVCIARVD